MNVLIVDDRVPDPHFGAGFPRAYRLLLSLLQTGHRICFLPTVKQSIQDLDLSRLGEFGVEVIDGTDKLSGRAIDVVFMSRPHNVHYFMPPIKKILPNSAKFIYDTEALWYRRYDLQLSITGRLPAWAYRYDELGLARQVDLCFVVNDAEKKILEDNGVRKVVKLAHALEINRKGLPFEDRKDLLVVGGKLEEDSTNEDALWWYLENCWSSVCETLQAQMDVTGTVLTARLQNNTFGHVNLLGHINDLTPLYESHRIFVAATRFATGIPWKVHEAMANGTPCIISRLLANQLGLSGDIEAMICDTPQEFTAKTIMLYENKAIWESIRENAFNYVERDCSIANFKEILGTTLNELVA
jgi:glycosyltransferase involved in cell wall biosynthesis